MGRLDVSGRIIGFTPAGDAAAGYAARREPNFVRAEPQPPASAPDGEASDYVALLRETAVALDRARSGLERQNDAEAVEAWRALGAGRWSVFDYFDADGRRVLIAECKEGNARLGHIGIRPRTQQVLSRRALGYSLKVIASELGISIATVSREVTRGLAALGVTTPAELTQLVALPRPFHGR